MSGPDRIIRPPAGAARVILGTRGLPGGRQLEIPGWWAGRPGAGEVLFRLHRALTWNIDPAACGFSAVTAATEDAVLTVTVDGEPVWRATFEGGGSTVPTVEFLEPSWPPGLTILAAPTPQDASLAGLSLTFGGLR